MSRKETFFLDAICLLGLTLLILSSTGFAQNNSAGSVSPVGSWFGNAKPPDDAVNPAFPEVVMMPTFFDDGNIMANDSHEINNPHSTSHGSWVRLGGHQIKATFIWINFAEPGTVPNGVAGTVRVTLIGEINPKNQNEMTGTLHAIFFMPGVNPLDPNSPGIDLGVFNIEKLQRIR